MRRIIVAAVVACGLITAPLPFTPQSSAVCDSASCVPNVARNVVAGTPCTPSVGFVFGLASDNSTLICAAHGVWVPTGPLIGDAQPGLPCATPGTTAQVRLSGNHLQGFVPGIPLQCVGPPGASKWSHFDLPS